MSPAFTLSVTPLGTDRILEPSMAVLTIRKMATLRKCIQIRAEASSPKNRQQGVLAEELQRVEKVLC